MSEQPARMMTSEEIAANYISYLQGKYGQKYSELFDLLMFRDSAARLTIKLPKVFHPKDIAEAGEGQNIWSEIGNFYRFNNRFHEAIRIYMRLYEHMLQAQFDDGKRHHKGMPLCWIYECCKGLNYPSIAKRFIMLTLCEDAIYYKGNVPPDTSGTYFRLNWATGLSHEQEKNYEKTIWRLSQKFPDDSMFPEWILQELDQNWITEYPSPNEAGVYLCNIIYIHYLMKRLGEKSGKTLERLAQYMLSCMPGCRTTRRRSTYSTDYDVICSMEGFDVDFRSELGRYFVCECKDWSTRTNFSTMAKFCRVLDSIKSHFGILFSREGLTGEGKATNAEREQIKIFQDRGMVIVVFDEKELGLIAKGGNFIDLLREKYDRVRLDLRKPTRRYLKSKKPIIVKP